MSGSHPSAKKLVQISEEFLPPVYVPFVLGNEFYVMTQQDIRRLEDTRFLSVNKLYPNGDLYPIQAASVEFVLQLLKKYNECVNIQNSSPKIAQEVYPQPMEISTTDIGTTGVPCAMGVEQQLKWNKYRNTSAPYPFSYSRGTSTTELSYSKAGSTALQQQHTSTSCASSCPKCKCGGSTAKMVTFCSGTNTVEEKKSSETCLSAREQLKQKKMLYSYIS